MAIIAIVGSRNFNDYHFLSEKVSEALKEWEITEIAKIVSGGAAGVDTLACRWAKEREIPIQEHFPDWDKYGRAAGPIRNKLIVNDATHIIAFPTLNGRGTQNTIRLAEKKGVPVKRFTVKN